MKKIWLMKLDLSLKDWTSNTRDQLVQLASCCIVGSYHSAHKPEKRHKKSTETLQVQKLCCIYFTGLLQNYDT